MQRLNIQLPVCKIILYFYKNTLVKKLFIIRHAKSDQTFYGNDFERPLNERGKNDAPKMGERLIKHQKDIDAFVASPAKRAKQTAEAFAAVYKTPADKVIFISALYHAAADVFYEVITALPDDLNTIALFSHNPGITYYVNSLQTEVSIDNMPTCGIFAVEIDIISWSEFGKAKKEFLFFDYPKKN